MNLFEPLQPSGQMPVGAGSTLAPGAMLEDFVVTQVLGLTSFGVLYQATHAVDGNTVVLKEYLPAALAARSPQGQIELLDPSHEEPFQRGLQSFITESLTLSQFDHPNLLRVSCVWEANGTAYRAMPLLAGNALLALRSSSDAPASQAQLQALLDGLLGALDTLGAASLSHGQITPANILMLEDGQPVLMDFDAVHQAVQSDLLAPHVDAYADPGRAQQMRRDDLHAVAAVLHFAISGDGSALKPGEPSHHEPLADVLMRLKDSASALGYLPEFLAAVDTVLAVPATERPSSTAAFRALVEGKPMPAEAPPETAAKPARAPKRPKPERTANEYPLNSSESVLALLAVFGRQHAAAEHVEPFQSPTVPTLTEEAEPTHPPMRTSLFDAMDAGEALPEHGVVYGRPSHYTPMPSIGALKSRRRQRMLVVAGIAMLVVVCVGAFGWQLLG